MFVSKNVEEARKCYILQGIENNLSYSILVKEEYGETVMEIDFRYLINNKLMGERKYKCGLTDRNNATKLKWIKRAIKEVAQSLYNIYYDDEKDKEIVNKMKELNTLLN